MHKDVSLWQAIVWFISVVCLGVGVGGLLEGHVAAVFVLLLGLWLLPPLRARIAAKYPTIKSKRVVWAVGIALLVLFSWFIEGQRSNIKLAITPTTTEEVHVDPVSQDRTEASPTTTTKTPSSALENRTSAQVATNSQLGADAVTLQTDNTYTSEPAAPAVHTTDTDTSEINEIKTDRVVSVVDGDTFTLSNGETVRLIGINAPERGQAYYEEAATALSSLVYDKMVRLEKDVSDRDRYGRLLAYVYVDDLFVNEQLVRQGYAKAYRYGPDTNKQAELQAAEAAAQADAAGMWAPRESVAAEPATTDRGEVNLQVIEFNYDSPGNDNDTMAEEYFVLKNNGAMSIALTGYTVSDAANHVYTFPNLTLESEAAVTVRTGSGSNSSTDLYWGSDGAVWNNGGDTLYLRDDIGNLVLRYTYP